MTENPSIAVVGGGWAGLSTAVHLTRHGFPVSVFESARQLGGRARCIPFGDIKVDNGQHLMIGAYQSLLHLLRILDVEESQVFSRLPLALTLLDQRGRHCGLRTYPLPAPLHLLIGIFRARGFNLMERAALMRFSARLARQRIRLDRDISVQALLLAEKQPPRLIHYLWEPLCLASLNTGIQDGSATLFLNVLQEAFAGPGDHSDLLIPITDLGSLLPRPALDYIEKHGGDIHLSQRIETVQPRPGQRQTLQWETGEAMFDHVVLATPPGATRRLLPDTGVALSAAAEDPICTVYLQFPEQVRLPQPMLGLVDHIGQWLFDRRLCGQPGLIAVVISGQGPHMELDNERLTLRIIDELQTLFQDWPFPDQSLVVREKRATFHAGVGIEQHRPNPASGVPGIWLAGDFVANGLPATLEGAVRNGERCARAIVDACRDRALPKAV